MSIPELIRGTGSARGGRPDTPAMAAAMTDHLWTTTERWSYRVPASFLDRLHTTEHLFPSLGVIHQGR
ncbi:MAG: hypothetical protein IPL59_05025 [Candidatus Competibacteraceae bacterium]|nr:hypothetical protein [Candidatus Competibacteraceae bacterium]MBK8755100.1 hypothetical protein [Candidatus Competibacteraceae bacterium]